MKVVPLLELRPVFLLEDKVMPNIGGAVFGAFFGALFQAVVEANIKAEMFKTLLEQLKFT